MAKHTLKSCDVHTARFLKYVWPFFSTLHGRLKPISHHMETSQQIFTAINGWFQYDGNISLERVGYLPGIVG